MKVYTSVIQWGDRLLVRGVNNGKAYAKKVPFKPTLYMKTELESDIKSMFGDNLKAVEFDGIKDAKEFVDRYEGMESVPIFGNTGFVYQYTHQMWPEPIEFDQSQLNIQTMDIETGSENGFPDVYNPIEELLLISMQNLATKQRVTWGCGEFNLQKAKNLKSKENINYVKCKNERDLIERFLMWWRANPPDVITGWNIRLFDIPYLVSRIAKVMGGSYVNMLSPWDNVREKTVRSKYQGGAENLTYDILGVAQLDYFELFQKFGNHKSENNKLDTVAFEILGRNKLENPYETYRDFYKKDWQLFVEYNMIDVELVDELDDKMQLMSLALTMAYDAKCNFSDVFSPVKLWDCLIYNHLASKNVQVHQRIERPKRRIEGGFVRDVERPQKYEWVVSFDATSLYPSIILQYNMSPEKMVEGLALDTTVDGLMEEKYDLSILKEKDVAMTANGYTFKRDSQGVFPEIVERLFKERVAYKKQMQVHEREYEKTKDPLQQKLISKFDNFQQARKILLNSLFGASSNQYFRFFDTRIAEGITMTGQYIIQRMSDNLNVYLNKACKTSGVTYSFYSDTDSCYVTMAPLVEKLYKHLPTEKIVTILDKICKDQLNKVLVDTAEHIKDYTNAFEQRIFFKREAIADHTIFLGKKHYALNVWDSEGLRYKEPKIKVKGLELVKSSTPGVIRKALKDALKICLVGTEKQLHKFIEDYEQQYKKFTTAQIAFPRGCNGLGKYKNSGSIYAKGCPMHVRAALLYNYYIQDKGLEDKYPLIQEGEKIRFIYLKEPNTIGENTIAFLGSLPKELGLTTYVDYNIMFEKSMIEPTRTLTNALGWNPRPVATLEGLFDD